jgi:hypothetical protein
MRHIALLAALAATPVIADCPGEQIFSCKIRAKTLELCLTSAEVRYSFGRAGDPDLILSADVLQVDFIPWNGWGRTMLNQVRFYKDGVTYAVWASIDKQISEDDPERQWQGGVNVTRGDDPLADLTCSGPPDPPWIDALYDAKQRVGQCWDFDQKVWAVCD